MATALQARGAHPGLDERFVLIARRKTSVGARSPVVRSEGGQNRMFSAESPDLRVVVNCFQELKTLTEAH